MGEAAPQKRRRKRRKLASGHVWAGTAAAVATVVATIFAGVGLFSKNKASISGSTVVSGGTLFGSVTQTVSNPLPPKPIAGSPEDAKAKLHDDGLEYSMGGFVKALDTGTPDVADLYLTAGMSPTAISPNSNVFVLDESMLTNRGNANGMLDVFLRHHANLQAVNSEMSRLTNKTVTMGDELFDRAYASEDTALMKRLLSLHVHPTNRIESIENGCRDSRSEYLQAKSQPPPPIDITYEYYDSVNSAWNSYKDAIAHGATLRNAGLPINGCDGHDLGPKPQPSRQFN